MAPSFGLHLGGSSHGAERERERDRNRNREKGDRSSRDCKKDADRERPKDKDNDKDKDRERDKERREQSRDRDNKRRPATKDDNRASRHGPPLSMQNLGNASTTTTTSTASASANANANANTSGSVNRPPSRTRPSSQHQSQSQNQSRSSFSSFGKHHTLNNAQQYIQFLQQQNHHYPPASSSAISSSASSASSSSPSPSSTEWPQPKPLQQRHTMDERVSPGNLKTTFRSNPKSSATTATGFSSAANSSDPQPSLVAARSSTFSTPGSSAGYFQASNLNCHPHSHSATPEPQRAESQRTDPLPQRPPITRTNASAIFPSAATLAASAPASAFATSSSSVAASSGPGTGPGTGPAPAAGASTKRTSSSSAGANADIGAGAGAVFGPHSLADYPDDSRRQGIVFNDSFDASPDDDNDDPILSMFSSANLNSLSNPPAPPPATTTRRPATSSTIISSSLFNIDSIANSNSPITGDSSATSSTVSTVPPPIPPRNQTLRNRTLTMDGSSVRQSASSTLMGMSMGDFRNRVGSFSGATSSSLASQDEPRFSTISSAIESTGYPSIQPSSTATQSSASSSTAPPVSMSNREKKSSAKRLMKRNSRPTSPVPANPPPPCISTIAVPIPTANANKILVLMKTLCGRMRGKIDYRTESGGAWYSGVCWIDEESGCLMFDPSHAQGFVLTLCADLRGSQVIPKEDASSGRMCIDIVTGFPLMDILIRPSMAEEFDLWLAALLCWQDVRQPGSKHGGGSSNSSNSSSSNGNTSPGSSRPELRRQLPSPGQGTASAKSSTIKVAKVGIWDKGYPATPRAAFRNSSPYDRKLHKDGKEASWAKVSCLLQDSGELRFQNDLSFLNIIDVTQLARSAIQHLDRSVFEDVEFCLAIFPIYAPSSTHLCFSRPIYVSFDSRMLMDVWYVLLRSFAQPHLFRHDALNLGPPVIVSNFTDKEPGDVFRIERTLKMRVTEAKLKARDRVLDIGYSRNEDGVVGNYFAEIILDGEVRTRTIVKTNTKNPFWREDCAFTDIPPTQPLLTIILKRIDGLEAERRLHFSRPVPPSEVWCGSVDIPIEQLEKSDDHEQWLQILDQKHLSIGTMLVKVQHEEMAVLLASEYEPLRELLQRSPAPMATKIARLMPGGLRKLSETLLNVFQVSGNVNQWLMALVEEEIDGVGTQEAAKNYRFDIRLRSSESMDFAGDRRTIVRGMNKALAGEANLLFRGNSLLTQALECHMRRLGKEYLEEVLKDKIAEINDMNPNCEIDPSKLEPNEDMNRHWTLLLRLTTEVWTCIASSASQLPGEIRHILKFVRAVAEDRYGDFSRTVSYTSVTGFLFLRFICPAILSPKLFGLLRDIPSARVQRTFTFIAKALQAMANMSTFGQKESWMEPMNRFINQHRQSFKDYVDEACAIVDYQQPHISPSYSTPHAIMNRMCATSREGVPMLPYLVDPARNMATLVKMWTSAHAHDSEDLPSGDIFLFNSMCHALQKRADACMKSAELLSAAAEVPPVASTAANVDANEPTELNPVTMEHEGPSAAAPAPGRVTTSMSASSLPSLASTPFHEFTRDREDLRAPGSAGSDIVETAVSYRKQTMSAITTSSMGTPSSTSFSSVVASRRTSAAAALSGSTFAGIGRQELQALAQLQLHTQAPLPLLPAQPAPASAQLQSPLSAQGDAAPAPLPVHGTVTTMAWAGNGPPPDMGAQAGSTAGGSRAARNSRMPRNIISAVMRMGRSGEGQGHHAQASGQTP